MVPLFIFDGDSVAEGFLDEVDDLLGGRLELGVGGGEAEGDGGDRNRDDFFGGIIGEELGDKCIVIEGEVVVKEMNLSDFCLGGLLIDEDGLI